MYPVTLREYEQSRFRVSYIRHVLIDDADAVLEQVFKEVTIDAITMTECVMEQEPGENVNPVVHAHWIPDEIETGEDSNTYKCSACGQIQILIDGTPKENGWNYCPHCGAKMDEEDKHETD